MKFAAVLLSLIFVSSLAYADTPLSLDGATVVDAKKAKELMDSDKNLIIVDTRVKNEFAEEHLPKAKSIVYGEKSAKDVNYDASKDTFDVSQLGANKDAPVLMYCNGPECWKSFKASKSAMKAGYKKIYWFRTGMPDWKKNSFATAK